MPAQSWVVSGSGQGVRRSSRLRARQGVEDESILVKLGTTGTASSNKTRNNRGRSKTSLPKAFSSARHSQALATATELRRREAILSSKEEELQCKSEELHLRLASLSAKENETHLLMSRAAGRDAKAALAQLQEHFTCALCCEVMGSPYILNPANCGHTFCGLCILKWFFSRLHRICGGWHESVACPLCRSLLVITPDRIPRSNVTFPFVPNRTAATILESLIDKLLVSSTECTTFKREQSESAAPSCSKTQRKSVCDRLSGEQLRDEDTDTSLILASWKEGGTMRTDWLKRDRDGKREMNYLLRCWSTMASVDFIAMKERLGVSN